MASYICIEKADTEMVFADDDAVFNIIVVVCQRFNLICADMVDHTIAIVNTAFFIVA